MSIFGPLHQLKTLQEIIDKLTYIPGVIYIIKIKTILAFRSYVLVTDGNEKQNVLSDHVIYKLNITDEVIIHILVIIKILVGSTDTKKPPIYTERIYKYTSNLLDLIPANTYLKHYKKQK